MLATDSGGHVGEAQVEITVEDENDNHPVFIQPPDVIHVRYY